MSAGKAPAPGPAAHNLIANVKRLRREQGLSLRKLSALLAAAGRPIIPIGLSRLENAERRVDVDDLLVLAQVFGVTPGALLAPPGEAAGPARPEHAAAVAARQLADRVGDLLEAAGDPGAQDFAAGSVDRALRRVQIEIEELFDRARRERRPA